MTVLQYFIIIPSIANYLQLSPLLLLLLLLRVSSGQRAPRRVGLMT